MFPADDQPPAETKPPVRPPVRPNRPKRKKGAKYIQWAAVLAYFFAFRYISGIYISQKKAICLGSITKCDVIRSSGGLQSRVEQKPHLKTPSCGFFHNGANGLAWSFVFYVSWVVGKLPKTVCKGWIDKVTPALQVVIVSHLLGEHKRDGNRMNSSDSWRCGILGVCPC